ncbi:MAG: hypothetical protein RLZZ272_1502 [Actinomycetota bacterium]
MPRRSVAALAAVGASAWLVASGRGDELDRAVRDAVVRLRAEHGERLDPLVAVGTDLGSLYGLVGVAGAVAASGRRRGATRVLVAGSLAWGLAQAAKPLLGRARPYELDGEARAERLVAEPAGSSWPSGHAAVAAAMHEALSDELGPSGRRLTAALALAVAVSRCYVGVHHATDVIGGHGIGILAGRIARRLVPPRDRGGRGRRRLRRR